MNRAFSAGVWYHTNPWGDAPGCLERAPLARRPNEKALRLLRRGIWQNDANRRALADHAFRFDPAAVELRDVFYDG